VTRYYRTKDGTSRLRISGYDAAGVDAAEKAMGAGWVRCSFWEYYILPLFRRRLARAALAAVRDGGR
jgi:hypothetical protein